ncbi:bZIP 2 and Sas10 Utp3 domain containing protein [Trichuris trichiura]|uniref:BZIP 2 and Sas10 Utp3 domain containing protein n=1 Tax=Trichuris trichiura TaxID=36087 RepID=A0A077Z9D5_TRITR|nr:bZIP 2 and Sas10 Utp3 domain containing protein [Trichuris trichiura]
MLPVELFLNHSKDVRPVNAPKSSSAASCQRRCNWLNCDLRYQEKRERNNEAVRKSRMKRRNMELEKQAQVQLLRAENEELESRVAQLQQQLSALECSIRMMPKHRGISFLKVKAHTQLSYLENLGLLILKKLNRKLQDSDEDVEVESEVEEKREQESALNKKYIAPKLMATPYIEPKNREVERMRRRIMNTSMLQDLKNQYSQAPEEIIEGQSLMKHRELLEQQRKTEYEEEHFIRLRQPKGQSKMSLNAANNLDGVFDFAGYFASSSGLRVSHLHQT